MEKNQQKKKLKGRTIIVGLIGAVIGSAMTITVAKYFSSDTTPDKELAEKAIDINKICPAMIDEGTRFDFVNIIPGNKFQFNYTMINAAVGYVDTIEAIKYIKPNVVKYLKTNTDMKVIRNHKTTVFYNYKDRNGNYLFKIPIYPSEY